MAALLKATFSRERAAALIIVLAFVVLFTGLVVAYLSRATSDRPVAQSSFNQTKADQLAQSAMDNIIGDVRQEILDTTNGSTVTTVNGITIYTPKTPANMVPQRSGTPSGSPNPIPNLVRRSVRLDPIPAPGRPSRASAVNSTADVSANGRYITSTRWNSHYLVPKGNTATADSSPIAAFTNATPDWVMVTTQGATPAPAPSAVIGRYAYAIYDEGGLLDANLVGLPSPLPGAVTTTSPVAIATPSQTPSRTVYISRRGTAAFADLAALPLTSAGSTPDPATISKFVGWRNYVTCQSTGTFPNLSASAPLFVTYFLNTANGFLTASPTPNAKSNRTDQVFVTRSELIQLQSSIGPVPNLLQYLGTFSREQNAPTWNSASNPILQRFQLGNISFLSPTPPPGANVAAIQTYFGLHWSTANNRWQYWGQGTSLASAIGTPAPTGSPAPDFFQILSYAYSIPGPTLPISKILSLGAAIIDQYDSDNVITAIEYGPAAVAPAPQPVAWGMEPAGGTPMGSGSPSPTPWPPPAPPAGYVPLQRPFQNVGELGYAYNSITGTTLNFRASGSDAALLDFFTYNVASPRAGPVNLNTRNTPIIAAILKGALPNEPPATAGVSASTATTAASLIAAATKTQPAISRQDIARLAAAVGTTIGSTKEQQETVARALGDATQTRTWGLMIDLIAQSGRYKPGETDLTKFIVEGEQHYWVHVAIDRFTGQVIGKQIEVVNE